MYLVSVSQSVSHWQSVSQFPCQWFKLIGSSMGQRLSLRSACGRCQRMHYWQLESKQSFKDQPEPYSDFILSTGSRTQTTIFTCGSVR
jgi:hypothetical protein